MYKLKRYQEVIFNNLLDFMTILAGWFLFHVYFADNINVLIQVNNLGFFSQAMALSFYWLLIFVVIGLYKKIKFDLFYIENDSLRMNAKILISNNITIIKGKGQ